MGQFGPTFAPSTGIRRFSDSGIYVLGALVSSTAFLFVVDIAGGRFAEATGRSVAALVALVSVCVLMLVDAIRLWAGRSMSFGPSRQTPYRIRLWGWTGVLAWGLDTGLPVSTVRATPLPMIGVILTGTGHAGPLHGVFYGLGITLGLLVSLLNLSSPERIDRSMDILVRQYRSLNPAILVLAPSGLAAAAMAIALADAA